jgi:DNA-directed RNA polymerase specialized sigma54-like protein
MMNEFKSPTLSLNSIQKNLVIPNNYDIPKFSPSFSSEKLSKEQIQDTIDSLPAKEINYDLVKSLINHLEKEGYFINVLENNQFFEKMIQAFELADHDHVEVLIKLSTLAIKGSLKLR